jgi:hypothetical protein
MRPLSVVSAMVTFSTRSSTNRSLTEDQTTHSAAPVRDEFNSGIRSD